MDNMREEFESWCDEQGYASDKYSADDCGDKYKHLVGEYVISETRFLWEAWEASRAALCVELPQQEKVPAEMSMSWQPLYKMMSSDVIKMLEDAGVSYK